MQYQDIETPAQDAMWRALSSLDSTLAQVEHWTPQDWVDGARGISLQIGAALALVDSVITGEVPEVVA